MSDRSSTRTTENLSDAKIIDYLQHIVGWAIEGMGPFVSAEELAESYAEKYEDTEEAIEAMIRAEMLKAGVSGFLMGVPGFLALPFTMTANLGADYLLGARLISAIAHLRGWDIHSEPVRRFVSLCLLGNKGKEILKSVSKVAGVKVAQNMFGRVSTRALVMLNARVGANMVARLGERTVAGLTHSVPLVGGVIGSGFDCCFLYFVAKAAREVFVSMDEACAEAGEPIGQHPGFGDT